MRKWIKRKDERRAFGGGNFTLFSSIINKEDTKNELDKNRRKAKEYQKRK